MKRKLFTTLAILYFLATTFFFLQNASRQGFHVRFLYPDTTTVLRTEAAQSEHQGRTSKFFARFFSNKPLGYFQTYLDNVYRSVDIPFLFTLTTGSSMYDDQGPMQILYPWELLLFIPALIFLIRSGNRKYQWLGYFFLASILLPAFFLPPLNQLKLFPEIIGIRLVIIFGLYEGGKKWLKK